MKNVEVIRKDAFCVIGKAGSTDDGPDFVQRLWQDANSHFSEVEHLAKRNENGNLVGVWGIMTNFAFEFLPWEDGFSKGLYLAGLEVETDAVAPEGWRKWIVPGFEYWKGEGRQSGYLPGNSCLHAGMQPASGGCGTGLYRPGHR